MRALYTGHSAGKAREKSAGYFVGNFAGLLVERTFIFLHILLRERYGSSAGYSTVLGSKVLSVDGSWERELRSCAALACAGCCAALERAWTNANFIL